MGNEGKWEQGAEEKILGLEGQGNKGLETTT